MSLAPMKTKAAIPMTATAKVIIVEEENALFIAAFKKAMA